MDDRIRQHAETLVDWSARIEADDDVVLRIGEGAHELAVAVAAEVGARGANLLATYESDELERAYLTEHDGNYESPEFEVALYERANSVLSLRGTRNFSAMSDVPGDKTQAYTRSRGSVREARLATRWMSTIHPTRAMAQRAGMSVESYRDFVYQAILRDWDALASEMAQLVDIIDGGETVRLVKPTTDSAPATDLTMSIANRTAVNSAASVVYDSHNLPSGEVFTAPVVESVSGTVHFDVPMTIRGQSVRDVILTLEEGAVVDIAATQGESILREILDTDEGARHIGELGIGMNRGIDRPTGQILFDEKMAGTVHLALGRAYDACLPSTEQPNQSAVHVDLISDMETPGTRIEVDGQDIQRAGRFRWEEGFG